ncbi:MAG: hypothetical protein NUV46_03495 [Nanoarchaeota archaeon]|nr:hypothetical protein [Nanoarchaeota archaeon]
MKTISNLVKIITGRKLSEKKMEIAKKSKESSLMDFNPNKNNRNFYNIFFSGKKFQEKKVKYTFQTTPDASEGMSRLHKGYYAEKIIESTYNIDGMIEKKSTSIKDNFGWDSKLLKYTPSGSWKGKVVNYPEFNKEE